MHKRTVAVILVLALGIMFISSVCYAQENKVVRFFKNLINWPFSITKKSSEAVGRTTHRAVTTGTTTSSSAVETITGKPEKIKDVVVEPVKGSAETAVIAVGDTVKAPIEGTTEAFSEE